ncbi:hypothetical protein NV379_10995 [Paenibacillus sp. N1-5-1-14]|uniref:hypothetical protein n=1 Tax=Paenibacillus radicibacter TaxID=2972488 RepID=UPI002158AF1B|nr:hypothetical protein [Paenibacillus radicibacter]MCR8643187.1 hypothetical protein [Paenibacillus radicibacter]
MTNWQGIKFLVKREFSYRNAGYVGTTLFLVACFLMFLVMIPIESYAKRPSIAYFPVNVISVTYLSLMGFGFKNSYMKNYWKTDAFRKELSWLKLMPISSSQIVKSKFMKFIIHVFALNTILFSLLYIFTDMISTYDITTMQYVQMVLTVMGYSMVTGTLYLWFEMSLSGKMYLVMSFAVGIVAVILVALLGMQQSVWDLVTTGIKTYSWIIPTAFIVLGICIMLGVGKVMEKSLNKRDLYV